MSDGIPIVDSQFLEAKECQVQAWSLLGGWICQKSCRFHSFQMRFIQDLLGWRVVQTEPPAPPKKRCFCSQPRGSTNTKTRTTESKRHAFPHKWFEFITFIVAPLPTSNTHDLTRSRLRPALGWALRRLPPTCTFAHAAVAKAFRAAGV